MAYVGPTGPLNAKLAIVGEKPGREELAQNEPFVGPSGHQLNVLLTKIGIHRSQVYITNAVKTVDDFSNPTRDQIEAERFDLYRELLKLPNLNCIVPMGNVALAALSNFQLDSITSYRGSILPSFIGKKMVPTFHPAYYMRGEWRFKPVVKFDLSRALEESYDPKINVPSRRCYIAQTRADIETIRHHFTAADYISFDIELLSGRYIQCIAFAKDPSEAYCIPLTNRHRKSLFQPEDELYAWQVIQHILAQEGTTYVTQNGLFDCWHLWRHGIVTPYMDRGFDTMLAHRVRAPDLPHDLGFLVSIYTREPYYKDESGDWKLQIRTTNDNDFWAYNCKDASCTLEVAFALEQDLARHNMLVNFRSEVQAQWTVVTKMRQYGMRIDNAALREAKDFLRRDIEKDKQNVEAKLGWLPNTKSSKDMAKFYDQLQLPLKPEDRTKTGKPKTDVERLYNHAYNHPAHRDILYTVASVNAKRTLESSFTNIAFDDMGYYHPSLDITKARTGRLASRGADEGGPQIQNIPKRIRNIFIPDNPNHELTNADLAGAESMIRTWLCGDPLLIEAFTKGIKIHKVTGCVIYRNWTQTELPPPDLLNSIKLVCDACARIGEKECNHSEYYMSKQGGHAMGYREGVRRFCHEQRKKGIFISEADAKRIRFKVVNKYLQAWHTNVDNSLHRTPWLETALGRRREFYGQLDDRLVNTALAWLCQALVGQITNRAMIWLDQAFTTMQLDARVWTQTHDSITTTHHKDLRSQVRELYLNAFHQPCTINNRELLIPIELTHGPNWRDLK